MSGWPTTRRYSRTLAEAFPCERWPAIEHHRAPRFYAAAGVALAIFIGVGCGLALIAYFLGA